MKFDNTVEGRLTSGATHDALAEIYKRQPEQTQTLLADAPQQALDYISRYTFWAQSMAGLPSDTQYNIAHQLVRAYGIYLLCVSDVQATAPGAKVSDAVQSALAAVPYTV